MSIITSWFKRRHQKPKTSLVIFGTDFGSYQFLQLVQTSRKYEVAGFVSSDHWQKRSGFGKIGVIKPGQLESFCQEQSIAAIVVTSDQKDLFERNPDVEPVRSMCSLIRHIEVLSIPQTTDAVVADTFILDLIQSAPG